MPQIGGNISDINPEYKRRKEQYEEAQAEAARRIKEEGGLLASVWTAILDFNKAAYSSIWSGFHGLFSGLFEAAEGFFRSLNFGIQIERNPDWWKPILKRFGFDDNDIASIEALQPGVSGEGSLIPFFVFLLSLINIVQSLGSAASGSAYKRLMSSFTPATPQLGEVLRASFIAPELHEEVLRIARENGLSDADLKIIYAANYALQPLELIKSAYFREGKGDAWLEERLREHGYTDERISEIKATMPVIPGISDLVYMMGREAFEPDMIARYGLDELYPGELTSWAEKQGMNEMWARRYWYAHWEHPGLQTVFELFHRDQITEDEMWNYYGLVEIPPFWREKLTNISYNVITRVDARRMWQLGVITDETQLFDLYRHMGYSPDDAQLMTDWTKTYSSEQERDLTRSDIESAYIDRDVSATEAVELLQRIGYPAEYANFIIYRAETEHQRKDREEKIDLIKAKYIEKLLTESETRNRLVGLGLAVERVNSLMDKWTFIRQQSVNLPSKTDLDKLLKNQIITVAQYTEIMHKHGYLDEHITWYLALIGLSEAE